MEEPAQAVEVRRRRGRAEVEQLLAEFEASKLSRVEFCRQKGLSLVTLARYRKRRAQGDGVPGSRWLAVEVCGGSAGPVTAASSGLALALAGGRRIEIGRGFDAATLRQLLGVLDGI